MRRGHIHKRRPPLSAGAVVQWHDTFLGFLVLCTNKMDENRVRFPAAPLGTLPNLLLTFFISMMMFFGHAVDATKALQI